MKNISVFDLVFIVIAALFLGLISYFDFSRLISQFSLIFAMLAYYTGKFVMAFELKRKANKNK